LSLSQERKGLLVKAKTLIRLWYLRCNGSEILILSREEATAWNHQLTIVTLTIRQVEATQKLKSDLEICSALGINLAKVSVQTAQWLAPLSGLDTSVATLCTVTVAR